MKRIDSDTYFTPLDAFAKVDPKYRASGPRFVELPNGRYFFDYPARAPLVPQHIKKIRLKGHAPNELQVAPCMEGRPTTASTRGCCSKSVVNLDRNFIFHRRILT